MAKGRRGTGEPYLRGKIYWIQYYVNGKPVRESTGRTSKIEAIKILNQKRSQADAGELTAAKCTIDDLLDLHIAELSGASAPARGLQRLALQGICGQFWARFWLGS